MLFSLIFRIISSTTVLLYPTYASYKTLSKRPANETDIERWLMYWSVLGVIMAIEYVAEWTISWIPFYYLFKTTFLLYLALPQTQGSTYIYTQHLYPFLHSHETEIDRRVVEAKSRFFEWIRIKLRTVWESFGGTLPMNNVDAVVDGRRNAALAVDTPPTLVTPMTNPLQLAFGLWRTYSPAIGAFLQQPRSMASPVAASPLPSPSPSPPPRPPLERVISSTQPPRMSSAVEIHPSAGSQLLNRDALLARRRALEAELAALNNMSNFPVESSTYGAGTSKGSGRSDTGAGASAFAATLASTAFTAMSTYLPTSPAADDRGKYEEIARAEIEDDDYDHDGAEMKQPEGKNTSWWWGSSNKGYERLKTE